MAKKQSSAQPDVSTRRTFLLLDDSDRFWNGEIRGTELTTSYGIVWGQPQTSTKDCGSAEAALKELDKRSGKMLDKGYVETTPKPIDPTQEALEAALVAEPEDLGAHSAYSDWLTEHGDPKGEFVQTHLALEDESLSKPKRSKLNWHAKKILKANEVVWFGELVKLFHSHKYVYDKSMIQWRRGWLDVLVIDALETELSKTLAQSPQLRLLRKLIIREIGKEEIEDGSGIRRRLSLVHLHSCPYLTSVRVLHLGANDWEWLYLDDEIIGLVSQMPRLEELALYSVWQSDLEGLFQLSMPNLRSLTIDNAEHYPVSVLAKNPSLQGLKSLCLTPCRFVHYEETDPPLDNGCLRDVVTSPHLQNLTSLTLQVSTIDDQGVDLLISSGTLARLEHLDLTCGNVSDSGAMKLAQAMDPNKLTSLILTENAIGEEGAEALREQLRKVELENQHEPNDFSYLGIEEEDYYDDVWE